MKRQKLPFLHPLFSDNMVLQRGVRAPVWGWARPGVKVVVEFAGQRKRATAGRDGRWLVRLDPMRAGPTPRTLFVSSSIRPSSASGQAVLIGNVLVGDVWICSGQSNMQMPAEGTTGGRRAVAKADFPGIRLTTIPCADAPRPKATTAVTWNVCSPTGVIGFSSVGYLFGRDVHLAAKVPLGLVTAAWGGTSIETWMSARGLAGAGVPRREFAARGQPSWDKLSAAYNGMIAPLTPLAIKGVVWYQGEANTGRPGPYRALLPAMIADWRKAFHSPKARFLLVQLPNYGERTRAAVQTGWAELREAQYLVARDDPATGLIVTIDVGGKDGHPPDKRAVGDRLARLALGTVYGRKVASRSPEFAGMTVKGGEACLRFRHVGGGFVVKGGGRPREFAVAGADGVFFRADAVLRGQSVVVSSSKVPRPVAVRYAWKDNPRVNLCNRDGLPLAPFRTDTEE